MKQVIIPIKVKFFSFEEIFIIVLILVKSFQQHTSMKKKFIKLQIICLYVNILFVMIRKLKEFIYSEKDTEKHYITNLFGIKFKEKKSFDMDSPKIRYEMTVDRYNQINEKLNRLLNIPTVKFSVIMPTYNRAFCFKTAINSLLSQSYKNFELIIIDDCSTDDTEKIIKTEYKTELDSGVIIYKKLAKNSGVCVARNEGLKLAQNDWIAYLDSDNEMSPYFLEVFKREIENNPNSNIFYAENLINNKRVMGKSFDFNELCKANYIDLGIFVHKKNLVEKYGNFDTDLKRFVDWDLIVRYTKNESPVFINKILLKYSNTGGFKRISNTVSFDKAMEKIKEKFKNNYGIE